MRLAAVIILSWSVVCGLYCGGASPPTPAELIQPASPDVTGERAPMDIGDLGDTTVVRADTLPSPHNTSDCVSQDDPKALFVSTDPQACAVLRFRCEAEEVPFSDACGCGCLQAP